MTQAPFALVDVQGQPAVELVSGDGARATVLLHGAHLIGWTTADGDVPLYLSPRAVLDGRQAVRGGVPVIFPQFNQRGPLPRHGFARGLPWQLVMHQQGDDDALAVLRLQDSEATRALWPQAFVAELSVRISGARLDIELAVERPAEPPAQAAAEPMRFTAALHTYLRVDDVGSSWVDGLQRLRYEDAVRHTEQVDLAARLQVAGELDRIYFDAARPLHLHDGDRRLEITSTGLPDVVVWNPGPERCAALADMPADGWRYMLCIEGAAIGEPVALAPGQTWIGRQSITVLGPAHDNDDAANDEHAATQGARS